MLTHLKLAAVLYFDFRHIAREFDKLLKAPGSVTTSVVEIHSMGSESGKIEIATLNPPYHQSVSWGTKTPKIARWEI